MTVRSTPIFIQGNSHPAEETRLMLGGMLGTVTGSFAGGVASSDPAHGVVRATDLAVTQNGTPNMTVNVSTGGAFIRGTQSANQGAYHLWNDASLSVAITAADATNPRRDLIIAQVRDANYSGATNDARIVVVTGTPAAVPSDPTLPANALVLARVAVAAATTSIVTANITDLRTVANQVGALPTFITSALATTAIPSPIDGQGYYLNTNTTAEGPQYWNGTAWRQPWNMPWGHVSTTTLGVTATYAATAWGFPAFEWNGTGVIANRRYKATVDFAWGIGTLVGQVDFGIGTAAGTGVGRVISIYQDTGTAPRQNSHSVTFTTTAGSMTRGLTIRKQTGGGNIDVLAQSQLVIEDIGPAGAPA